MRGMLLFASIGAIAWLSGCGENCQSTCRHVYDPSECGIVLAGVTPADLINRCTDECEAALQHPGDARFDPNQTPASDDSWRLQYDSEAAAWIDCVWTQVPTEGPSKECANIDPKEGGICAPI